MFNQYCYLSNFSAQNNLGAPYIILYRARFYDVIGLFEQLRRDSRMSFALGTVGRTKEDDRKVNGED